VPSEAINESTRREWRLLGFYYERDDEQKEWRILGTREGLGAFAHQIRKYANDPASSQISEHVHLGPYWYLEIGTSSAPEITDHWIAGPRQSLVALAAEIEIRAGTAKEGEALTFKAQFSPSSPYELTLNVQAEGFDPALADPECQ